MTAEFTLKAKQILADITLGTSPKITQFINDFYDGVPCTDLKKIGKENLLNAAIEIREFINHLTSGQIKVRVYNREAQTKTIVEVVQKDTPFIVDSITAEIARRSIDIEQIIHPVMSFSRDSNGVICDEGTECQESIIQIYIDRISTEAARRELAHALEIVLDTVKLAVSDWHLIVQQIVNAKNQLKLSTNHDLLPEAEDFLDWIIDNNFVLLGLIEYDIVRDNASNLSLVEKKDSALGIFKSNHFLCKPTHLKPAINEINNPYLVEVGKSSRISSVHRAAQMDYIKIQKFNAEGVPIAEYRIIGLFTSRVYYQSASLIPIIRHKITASIAQANFAHGSHNEKDLIAILESYPRDELFQITEKELFETAMGILSLSGRLAVRLFLRYDRYERFVSCLIYVPRDKFSTALREKIQRILCEAFDSSISNYYTQIGDSNLARLHLIIKTTPGSVPQINLEAIERRIVSAARIWSDDLKEAVATGFANEVSSDLFMRYSNAFTISYTNRFAAVDAVADIAKIELALSVNDLTINIYSSHSDASNLLHLKIYNPHQQISLSAIMPILDNLGFEVISEHTYLASPVTNGEAREVWIHHFRIVSPIASPQDFVISNGRNIEEAVTKIIKHNAENDRFNRLISFASLDWRQVALLRAYSRYIHQTGLKIGRERVMQTLSCYTDIAKLLIQYFTAKFTNDKTDKLEEKFLTALACVTDLADDTILRRFFFVMKATMRTNFFLNKDYISFKLNSSKVPNLPLPLPFAEIFVYSPEMEGIHLRGGRVARGGLRWSDRHEDYRTEVLGLMKAQVAKNSVIVPTGSKGGFVVKIPTNNLTREEIAENGLKCYRTFLRGLLDITDNIILGKIIHPAGVVRYDEDDPYLVVAADKGTATFSDVANSISKEYDFWLGDAFASGGSNGYDHKKMAITARGAWISVERHFLELGLDTKKEDFTVIGIGDMSGDVFGNGMLRSRHIKLIAAFNHLHIFIDPNPDAEKSFIERERLFDLARSSWSDYNPKLISRGGGVFERKAKTITINSEMKRLFDIKEDELEPDILIKYILSSRVDLLWNGGIGTYVKSSEETNEMVGDRANDSLRIDGNTLRVRVVGEGGNLGFTQKGRIEYSLTQKGKINTDAIDNSAGVDCSDHEVNIKIALSSAVASKKLTDNARNQILHDMTDEVAALVLKDNILQTKAISLAESSGVSLLTAQVAVIEKLELSGKLNPELEQLPDYKEITRRISCGIGLTRPELAVLLSYSKIALYDEIASSSLPDNKYFEKDLLNYFPKAMRERFEAEIKAHPLRREIIATVITNDIVNRAGSLFFSQMTEHRKSDVCAIVSSYIAVCKIFSLDDISESLPNRFLETTVEWLLSRRDQPIDIEQTIADLKPIADSLDESQSLDDMFIACRSSDFLLLNPELTIHEIVSFYHKIAEILSFGDLYRWIDAESVNGHWQKLAANSMRSDLLAEHLRIMQEFVAADNWEENQKKTIASYNDIIKRFRHEETISLLMVGLAIKSLHDIRQ